MTVWAQDFCRNARSENRRDPAGRKVFRDEAVRQKDKSKQQVISEQFLSRSECAGKDFCLLRCHVPVDRAILTELPRKPEISSAGHYMLNISRHEKKSGDCNITRVVNDRMIEDSLKLDPEQDEDLMFEFN